MGRWEVRMTTNASDEEIDRVLSFEDEILPSSGFAISVMDAVRRGFGLCPSWWFRALPWHWFWLPES
jgi:hypothetical protein